MSHPLALLRSLLFVPATHIERIPKALNSGADIVVVDWEDAVASGQKNIARAATVAYLAEQANVTVWVRINAVDTEYHTEDVLACLHSKGISGILLPKAECPDVIQHLTTLTGKPVIAIIETPIGLIKLPHIAAATGLYRLSYGGLDLAQSLGATPNTNGCEQLMHQVRFQLLLHSQINGLAAPIDTVYPDFKDDEGLSQRVQTWQQMGFAGMLCIHPRQVSLIHNKLTPSPELIAWAQAVVAEAKASGRLAFQLHGEMIDAPVIARARSLLSHQQPLNHGVDAPAD